MDRALDEGIALENTLVDVIVGFSSLWIFRFCSGVLFEWTAATVIMLQNLLFLIPILVMIKGGGRPEINFYHNKFININLKKFTVYAFRCVWIDIYGMYQIKKKVNKDF